MEFLLTSLGDREPGTFREIWARPRKFGYFLDILPRLMRFLAFSGMSLGKFRSISGHYTRLPTLMISPVADLMNARSGFLVPDART